MDVQIRELGPADDLDELLDLSVRAFGPMPPPRRERMLARCAAAIAERRYLAAFAGTRMAAAAGFHRTSQWWLGRDLPMAGVFGVAVAPEDRGRGIGRALMTALLDHIAAAGYPLSMLYPATMPIYRSLGWELAGHTYAAAIDARSLHTITAPRTAALRRATPDDAAAVRRIHAEVHAGARECGPISWDDAVVSQWLLDDDLFSYLAADGFVAYRWLGGHGEIHAERVLAGSQETSRAVWALLASSSSVASTVRVRVGPAEPFGIMMRERDLQLTSDDQWMLRVVDAPAAVAGRGFPAGLQVAAALRLQDAACPGNQGDWTLTVGGGKGTLERCRTAAADPLALGARGFAALYAGTTLPVLRRSGLATGGDAGTDALFDAAFAAQPFCLDTF